MKTLSKAKTKNVLTETQKDQFVKEYCAGLIDFPDFEDINDSDFMSRPSFTEWSKYDWEEASA